MIKYLLLILCLSYLGCGLVSPKPVDTSKLPHVKYSFDKAWMHQPHEWTFLMETHLYTFHSVDRQGFWHLPAVIYDVAPGEKGWVDIIDNRYIAEVHLRRNENVDAGWNKDDGETIQKGRTVEIK